MDSLPFNDTSPEFQRFWKRIENRIEKLRDQHYENADQIEFVGAAWRGVWPAWKRLVATREGREEVVRVQKKPFCRDDGYAVETLLNMAILTGHGALVEAILQQHDTLDPTQDWTTHTNPGIRTALTRVPHAPAVLTALAKRASADIGEALDVLVDDMRNAHQHGHQNLHLYVLATESWIAAGTRSEDVILPAIAAWATGRKDAPIEHPDLAGAVKRLESFAKTWALARLVDGDQGARTTSLRNRI